MAADFNGNYDQGHSLVLTSDGGIILAGRIPPSTIGDSNVLGMVRSAQDGSVDAAFGNNGKVMTSFGKSAGLWSVILQDTTRIVVAGTAYAIGVPVSDFVVTRYLSDGTLDPWFGTNGIVLTDMFSGGDNAMAIAVQTDSKILVAGSSSIPASGIGISVARYLSHTTTGLPTEDRQPVLTVYPNPAHEFITVRYEFAQPEVVSIGLLDLNGRLIHSLVENEMQPGGESTVRMVLPKGLAPGMYLLAMESESGRAMTKVVKD